MMRRLAPAALLACLALLSLISRAQTAEPPLVPHDLAHRAAATGRVRVIVRVNAPFVPEHGLASAAQVLSQRQVISSAQAAVTSGLRGVDHRIARQFDSTLPLLAIEASPDALRALESLRGVVTDVVEDRLRVPMLADSVPLINGDDAWTFGADGTGAVVAILDTGVERNHPFLKAGGVSKVIAEACFSTNFSGSGFTSTSVCPGGVSTSTVTGSAAPCNLPGCDHGTHVAGIAAGGTTGVLGAGVAPGARIFAIQVFSNIDGDAMSFDSDQIAALNHLFNHRNDFPGMKVAAANLSLGGSASTTFCDAEPQKAAIDQLRGAGIATAIASGNDGFSDALSSPGCISSAVSVGSTTKLDDVSFFSNVASFLSVLAPGGSAFGGSDDILSSVPGGGANTLGRKAGTSMATPHVAGAFAVLRQAAPNATVDQLIAALQSTGTPIPTAAGIRPRINVLAAVQQVGAPDLVVQTLSTPTTALPGATVNVLVSARNAGLGVAPATKLRLYLSDDNTITAGDTQLAEIDVPALAGGITSSARSVPVTIPPGKTPGPYFIGALVDPLATTGDTNSSNNTKAVALTVIQPDLLVTALSAPATGLTGKPLAISNTVRNAGTAAAGPFRLSFYMAQGDPAPGAGSPVGSRDLSSLAANTNSSAVTTITLPGNMSAGTYFLSARVDSGAVVTESNETNNAFTSAGQVTVSLFRPDLLMTAVSAPATGLTNRPLVITNTVRNQGNAPAGAFRVSFFMVEGDSTPGAGRLVGFRSLAGLAANTNSSTPTSITIPANLSAGSYFVSAVVDPQANVELPGDNNGLTATNPVAISLFRPDLVMTAVSAPATGLTSRPLVVTNTVRNQGNAPAGAFRVNFFMAEGDGTPGAGRLVGFRSLAGLAANTNSSTPTSITIPANLSAGSYFVSAVVDPQTNVELPGDNDGLTAMNPVAVSLFRPDLIVTALSAPASGQTNRPLAVTSVVRNQGPAPAGPVRVNFFMAQGDGTPGLGRLVGFRSMASLAGFTNASAVTTVMLPGNLSEGTHFLTAVVDPLANVELPVDNDGFTSPGQVNVTLYRPELTMEALRGPLFGKIGRTISVTSAVRNAGPAPATAFKIRFYVSSTSDVPGDGTPIGTRDVAGLAVGANVSAATTLTLPSNAGLTEGNYFLSAVADADNAQAELNDGDNGLTATRQIALTFLRSDLAVTAAAATPLLASPGFTVNVANSVQNVGDVATSTPVLVRFYLSATPTLSGGETVIGNRSIATPLAVNATSAATTPVTIPNGTAPGSYFIVVRANADDSIVEYPGSNNVRATASINVQRPNLRVVSITPPKAVIRGKGVVGAPAAAVVVKNIGAGPAVPFDLRVYARRDDGLPGANTSATGDLIFTRTLPTLAPNAATTVMAPVAVDEIVESVVRRAGNYFISAVADGAAKNDDPLTDDNSLTGTVKVAVLPDVKKLKTASVVVTLGNCSAAGTVLNLAGGFTATSQTVNNPSTFTATMPLSDPSHGFSQTYAVSGTVESVDIEGTEGKVKTTFTYTSAGPTGPSTGRGNINAAVPERSLAGALSGTDTSDETCTFSGTLSIDPLP